MDFSAKARPLRLDGSLGWAFLTLAAVFALFEVSQLDLAVQDRLFDFTTGRWLVNKRDVVGRAIFYTGPKAIIIALGVVLLGISLAPMPWRTRVGLARDTCDLWVVILTLACAPSLIGLSKATTNVFCPYDIRRYGGDVPYVKLLERYPSGDRPHRQGRGFPAGHASGGFSLLALAGLARTRRTQLAGIALGLAVGGAMGLYQMAKGAHYLSHTLVTPLVVWIVFLLWRRTFGRHRDFP